MRSKRFLIMTAMLLGLLLLVSGCSWGRQEEQPSPPNGVEEPNGQDETAGEETVIIGLYFADDQAQFLQREEREVLEADLPEAVVEELIKGSATGLGQTIPDDTELLGITIRDGIANVDLSIEFIDNHWGGSAGETMTVYSIVNSLADLEDIEAVQFMVEGEIRDEILVHLYYGEPIEPSRDLVN